MTSKIPISEIFYSIQGEGKFCGRPSLFIRVGGCNLRCPSFSPNGCDSFYAVDTKFKSSWRMMEVNEIISIIKKYYPCDIVLTGGEPTLYYKKLYPIVEKFQNITIETNATIEIDFKEYPKFKDATFAMSVKLSNSGEKFEKRVNKKAIKEIATNAKGSFFKFVVSKNSKIDFYSEIKEITKGINLPIYCMPLGQTKEEIEKNSEWTFKFCLKHNYFYSDRLHIRIFNKKRGV